LPQAVSAWGNDLTTPDKDGFVNAEPFIWKVFTWNDFSEHLVSATYDQTLPNYDGNYSDWGISALTGLFSNVTQSIVMFKGWSGISSYITPINPNLDTMLCPIMNNLEILRNLNGIYWPSQSINSLINWNVFDGYCIKVNQDTNLTIQGNTITNRTLNLAGGWHIIPVLSSSTVSALSVLSDPGIMLVKEIAGSKVYWPAMNINTLAYLKPGQAYYLYATTSVTLNFPAKTTPASCTLPEVEYNDNAPWNMVNPSPNSHLIAIPQNIAAQFEKGAVVGAFNFQGLNVGRTVVAGTDAVIGVFGDDPTTPEIDGLTEGEKIYYRIFSSSQGGEFELNPDFSGEGFDDGAVFKTNGLSVMSVKTAVEESGIFSNLIVYPNPTSDFIKISFNSYFDAEIKIELINTLGEVVYHKPSSTIDQSIDVSTLAEGCYVLRVSSVSKIVSKKVVIRK